MNQETHPKNPLDYIRMVFRRKWLIIVPMVFGIIGGIIAVNILPKIYQSSTLVLVEEGRVINPLIEGLAVSSSVKERLTVLREQILGWDRLNQLIKALNLAKDIKTQKEFEGLVTRLRRGIQVRLYANNIINISYQDKDPVIAMNMVKSITDIFIEENLKQQSRETDNAIEFINEQLALYQQKLKQGEIAAMEEQLNTLLMDSTDRHPVVIDLRRKIALAQNEFESGIYDVKGTSVAGTDNELAGLQEELSTLKEDLSKSIYGTGASAGNREKLAVATNEKLYKMLLLERVDKVTQRDTNVNQALYDELLKRLETAKITQRLEASKDGTRYTILDPARMPLAPVKPSKVMVLLAGLAIGLGVGCCLVFGVEMFDHSFINAEDAGTFLGLVPLGSISKIVTRSDIHKQKIRNAMIASLSIITTAGLLALIMFNVILGG